VSIRALYRRMPKSKRVCSYYRCQKELQSNPDFKNGHLYHHGCKMSAEEERYRCLECLNIFDATEASWDVTQKLHGDCVGETIKLMCPYCGSLNLKRLRMPDGKLVECKT